MNAAVVGGMSALLALVSASAVRAAVDGRHRARVGRRLTLPDPGRGGGKMLSAPAWLCRRLVLADVDLDAGRLWRSWLAVAGLSAGAALVLAGAGAAAVAAVTLTVAPAVVLVTAAGRADQALQEALPGALEAIARGLRSGASLVQAIGEASVATPGRLGHELGAVSTAVGNGESMVAAIDAWGARHGLAGVRLAVSALSLGAETGGGHARALDGVAVTIRSRLAVSREIKALSSQARLSGLVITVAPLGFAVLAAATDDRTAEFLLRSPVGLSCLTAGLVLDGLAALWMHRLARVEP